MSEQTTYTFDELIEKYPPRMRDVDELKNTDNPVLGPLDFLYIDDWDDLSKVGADINDMDRIDCEDDVNNCLDIQFVQCTYEAKYDDDEKTKLDGSLVAIVPFAYVELDYQEFRNRLMDIVRERGYGHRGCKTRMVVEDDEVE